MFPEKKNYNIVITGKVKEIVNLKTPCKIVWAKILIAFTL